MDGKLCGMEFICCYKLILLRVRTIWGGGGAGVAINNYEKKKFRTF